MEHLPLPLKALSSAPLIELQTSQFASPPPFATYRTELGHLLTGAYPHVPTQLDSLQSGRLGAGGVSSVQVVDFYQGWLVYSLVNEVLGEVVDLDEYVAEVKVPKEALEGTEWVCGLEDATNGEVTLRFVTTAQLQRDISRFKARALFSGSYTPTAHAHLSSCLDEAFAGLRELEYRFPGFTTLFGNEVVCMASVCEALDSAVTSVGQTLWSGEGSLWPAQAQRGWLERVWDVMGLGARGETETVMVKEGGWCPCDVTKVRDQFSSIAAWWYFGRFKVEQDVEGEDGDRDAEGGNGKGKGVEGRSIAAPKGDGEKESTTRAPSTHASCTPYQCFAGGPPEPKHFGVTGPTNTCRCPGLVTFPEEDLIAIYESGKIPCFAVGKSADDSGLEIQLIPVALDDESQKDPDNHFVALSHVWAEGMGNAAANSLPFCQISVASYWAMLAYQAVEEAAAAEERKAGRETDPDAVDKKGRVGKGTGINVTSKPKIRQVNLWVDTLCCPSTPGPGKNACLSVMRDIYSKAYAVLVKSSALAEVELRSGLGGPHKSEAGDAEEITPARAGLDLVARIYTSPWMRRMWTLQEGVLAGASKGRGAGDRLVFAFADGVMSLESIVALLKQAAVGTAGSGGPGPEGVLAFDLIGKFGQLSPMIWRLDRDNGDVPDETGEDGPNVGVADGSPPTESVSTKKATNFFLELLATTLKYRSLSVAADEPICLATLLGLRVNQAIGGDGGASSALLVGDARDLAFLDSPEAADIGVDQAELALDAGVCALWRHVESMVGYLPGDIVFSALPRSRLPGFRWAPRTMVAHAKYGQLFVHGLRSGEGARIVQRGDDGKGGGLEVRLRGIHLGWIDEDGLHGRFLLPRGRQDTAKLVTNDSAASTEATENKEVDEDSTRGSTTVIIQIPPATGEWYVLLIRPIVSPDSTIDRATGGVTFSADQVPNLPQLISTGKAAVLFKDLPDSPSSKPAVVVSLGEEQEQGHGGRHVTTVMPAALQCMSWSATVIASAAVHCLRLVKKSMSDVTSGKSAEMRDLSGILRDAARRVLREDDDAAAAAAEAGNSACETEDERVGGNSLRKALTFEALTGGRAAMTDEEELLEKFVNSVDRLAGHGGVGGKWCSEEGAASLWCVD